MYMYLQYWLLQLFMMMVQCTVCTINYGHYTQHCMHAALTNSCSRLSAPQSAHAANDNIAVQQLLYMRSIFLQYIVEILQLSIIC